MRLQLAPMPVKKPRNRAGEQTRRSARDRRDRVHEMGFLVGGRRRFLLCLQTLAERDNDEDAIKVWQTFNGLSAHGKRAIGFEELILKSKIGDMLPFIKNLSGVAFEIGAGLGNIFAGVHLPGVVAAGIARALKPTGVADRKMQFQHARFVPVQKGATLNVGIVNQIQNAPASEDDAGALPSFESESIALRKVIRREIPVGSST